MHKVTTDENMSTPVVTIHIDEPMSGAFEKMQKRKLRHLPVVNDSGEIVGMLSDRDVQRSMISEVKSDYSSGIPVEEIQFDPNTRVRHYMSWPVLTVDESTDLQDVAELMLRKKVSSVLVQRYSRPAGIVTTDDLVRVLIDVLKDPAVPERWSLESILSERMKGLDSVLI